jgi:site-specific recombinase XerD
MHALKDSPPEERSSAMRGQGRIFQRKYRDRRTGETKSAATYTVEYYVNGRMKRESARTTNQKKALSLLKRRQGKIAEGRRVDPAGERVVFKQLADNLLNDYKANRRRSLERVTDALDHLLAAFDGYRAQDICGDMVTKYVVDRQTEGAANATINREQAALKRMYRLAAEKLAGYCPPVRMLEENNVRQGFFERPEFEATLASLPADLKPVFEVAYITGWRIKSEILTRQRSHLDFASGWLRLEPGETKNRKGRMFPLLPELRAVLERVAADTRTFEEKTGRVVPWLFNRQGERIRSFRRAWITACRRAGLARVVERDGRTVVYPLRIPHDFRRTAVRNLERAGVPRSTAMAMVGHRTESIYRRYAIVDETMLREGAERLTAFYRGQLPAATIVALRKTRPPKATRPATRPVGGNATEAAL